MRLIGAACAGFLIAVLWMDLMFDSQVLSRRGSDELPEAVLSSIAGYYSRATTTSRPMSYLVAAVMAILLGSLAFAFLRCDDPLWLTIVAAALAGVPILLATVRTVRNAVRLGQRVDTAAGQSRLARSIFGDHVFCLLSMSAFLAVWLAG